MCLCVCVFYVCCSVAPPAVHHTSNDTLETKTNTVCQWSSGPDSTVTPPVLCLWSFKAALTLRPHSLVSVGACESPVVMNPDVEANSFRVFFSEVGSFSFLSDVS